MPKVRNFNQPPEIPQLEEEVLKFWQKTNAFAKSVQMRLKDKAYVFYDGPPFATGMPHYGHLLSSTNKDVIPRYWTMKGYRVERVWGWDCHGLPIENIIEAKLDIKGGKKGIEELGIAQFNQACRSEVMRLDSEWKSIIDRLGRWVDFDHNYKTMDKSFMESVWWGFKQLHDHGLIYQGKKVILYCPRCATPLSNFEIAMDNSYRLVTEAANTYKYQVRGQADTFLLAWSTTPWNKLATPALAVNPHLDYVKVKQGDEYYILAESTLKMLDSEPYQVVEKLKGRDLEKFKFELHYDFYPMRKKGEQAGVVVGDQFVTAQEGTGIVTLAVYGEDDLRVMQAHHIQQVEHVDSQGKLKPEVKPWAGMDILAVNKLVNQDLRKRGLIYQETQHTHKVAECYRCGTRLYHAPLPAWFIDIQKLKKDLLKENEKINWYPSHLKHGRFGKGLETAPDWNISRSRYWGTPMPIWIGKAVGKKTPPMRIIGSIKELADWAVNPQEVAGLTDIHREFIDEIEVWVDDQKTIKGRRIPEVFDCWVESGSMPFAAEHYPFANKDKFEQNSPAQFVSEYIAQTRAWFYCMHVISVGIFHQPPFENVLTTGTILAQDGSKMSKSKKNYPDPLKLIEQYGVDSLRLYLMSSAVMKAENLNFNEKEVADIRRKVFVIWWNVLSFYKTFADQSADVTKLPTVPIKNVLDRWLVSRAESLTQQVTKYMDAYDVVRASRTLMEFVSELSNWYLRLNRDQLRQANNQQSSQVLGSVIYRLAQLMAPFAPFFCELVHHNLVDDQTSIHHTDWPIANQTLFDQTLEEEMVLVRKVVELGHAVRKENSLKLRQPLASIKVNSPSLEFQTNLEKLLEQELNVKQISWSQANAGDLSVEFDLTLTPQLKAEGEAREIIRQIQKLRKQAGSKVDELVSVQLPSWPSDWGEQIQAKAKVDRLVKGDTFELL